MMSISPEVDAQTAAAAVDLKLHLEQWLKDKPHPGIRRHKPGPATVVDIIVPTDKSRIARCGDWRCLIRGAAGETWEEELECCIPWWELYPLFRNAFSCIAVEVDHPQAISYHDADPSGHVSGRKFVPSGRTVIVRDAQSVYVRPTGDLQNSVWLEAEICIGTDPQHFDRAEAPLIATCNVDPFALGQRRGRVDTADYEYMWGLDKPTFYVSKLCCQKFFAPIARLITFDEGTKEATFELDQSVEAFVPAANAGLNWLPQAVCGWFEEDKIPLVSIGIALLALLVGFSISVMAAYFCLIWVLLGTLVGVGVNFLAKKTPLSILVGAYLMAVLPRLLIPGSAVAAPVLTIAVLIFAWAGFYIGMALKLE